MNLVWPDTAIEIVLICVLALLARGLLKRLIKRWIEHTAKRAEEPSEGLSARAAAMIAQAGGLSMERQAHRTRTVGTMLGSLVDAVLALIVVFMVLQALGVNIAPALASAGIGGIAIGFGAQSLVKDVIGGFFLLVENQFAVGDIISIGDKHVGTVERMTLRITMLRDLEGQAHYLPNGSITDVVVLSKEFAKAMVEVEVSRDEDVVRVMDVLRELGTELQEALPAVLEPTEVLGITSLTPHSCVIRTLTKTAPGEQWAVARELRKRIVLRFQAEKFSGPLLQRVVWNRTWDGPQSPS